MDGRANYATQGRFASACRVLVAKPEEALEKIAIDDLTFFLLMTHNYNYDMAMLRQLLQKKSSVCRYAGTKKEKGENSK